MIAINSERDYQRVEKSNSLDFTLLNNKQLKTTNSNKRTIFY